MKKLLNFHLLILDDFLLNTVTDEREVKVLLDILDTPVSPELLPAKDGEISQKTEDLVGPYELHDFILYYALRPHRERIFGTPETVGESV